MVRRLCLGILSLVLLGCESTGAVVPALDESFLYVVLNQRSFSPDPTYEQRGLLLQLGSPARSFYRVADSFEMLRASDGAVFRWTDLGQRGPLPGDAFNAALMHGNYGLSSAPPPGELGSDALVPGETYLLTVVVNGQTVTGHATIPASFEITVVSKDGYRVAQWPRVVPGGLFSVILSRHSAAIVQPETLLVLPALSEATDLEVTALDLNLSRYLGQKDAVRSGITGAFGVFGAITTVVERIEP